MGDEAVGSFAALAGRTVTGWVGVEWALTGGDDGVPPVFERPDVPFRQFWSLDLHLAGGAPVAVRTGQADTVWGLVVAAPLPAPRCDGVTRVVTPTLPTGRVEVLAVDEEDGVVAEVLLAVGGRRVLLMAGEVQQEWDDAITFRRLDESVLVFEPPAAADAVPWSTPRPRRSADG